MNLHLWVTYAGDHSLAKLGAIFATSFPFDLAHVVGNVLFCLLFGPALVRALTRYRQRFEVTWRPVPALAAAALAALVLVNAAAPPADAAVPARVAELAGAGPERRRRLRRRARPALERALHRLGGPRARGRGAQPARRQPRARRRHRLPARPPARTLDDLGETDAHDPAAARRRLGAADRLA